MLNTLCNYYKDCIQEEFKSANFRNLSDDKIIKIKNLVFNLDDSNIVEFMTKAELNKIERQLIYGEIFIQGIIGKNTFNTPLRYYNLELKRQNDKIIGIIDDEPQLNIGAISNLLNTDLEAIESVVNTLLDYVSSNELTTVLKSLVDLKGLTLDNDYKAVILAKLPDATKNLINELNLIAKNINFCKNKY